MKRVNRSRCVAKELQTDLYTESDLTSGAFDENNPYVVNVLKNEEITTYKMLIQDGNSAKSTLPMKHFISYPYTTCQFRHGDYIHWLYGGENTTWLILSMDKQLPSDINGMMRKCNTDINVVVSAGSASVKGVFLNKLNSVGIEGNEGTLTTNVSTVVYFRHTADAEVFAVNQRFIFFGQAYKAVMITRQISDELSIIYLEDTVIDSRDDLVNGIAWNGFEIIPPIVDDKEPDKDEGGWFE